MTFLSRDDAQQQYNGCLVEYNGTLGFIREVVSQPDGSVKLAFKAMDVRNSVLIDPDPDAVLCPTTPYRLGYVQYTDSIANYMHRSPRRQYQIGWSESNVNGFSVQSLMRMNTRLLDNLLGKYPKYAEAVKLSAENDGTVAFDRMFAVSQGSILCYKGQGLVRMTNPMAPDWSKLSRYESFLRPLMEA